MDILLSEIAKADRKETEHLLRAVLHRYGQLYPEWEISTISLHKTEDRNEQLTGMIRLLETMKAPSE